MDYTWQEIYPRLERHGTKHKYIHHISEPIMVEQYVVIEDYVKREDSDISLKAGNVVDVIEKNEHGWWFVDLDGEVGWAPASYLEPRDGSADDQVVELFEQGKEETYITLAAYEPQLEDEVKFEMGTIVKVIQKNLDGWWLVRIEETEGWAPSVFLREIATSRQHAREKRKDAVRIMLRDSKLGLRRKQTWDPRKKKSVKRNIRVSYTDQPEAKSPMQPSYVNTKFLEFARRQAAVGGRTQPKRDGNDLRANVGSEKPNDGTDNTENAQGEEGPRSFSITSTLSVIAKESHSPETVSRGTSPIPSPFFRRNESCGSASTLDDVSHPISLRKCPDKDDSIPACDAVHAKRDSKEEGIKDEDGEGEGEGEERIEKMPELANGKKFYAVGSYEKEDDAEVNLREDAEVEVIRQSDGGWWLVRTSSTSQIGWAPSNFLEKVNSLGRQCIHETEGEESLNETDVFEVIPIRPPKSARILKMEEDICIEREFWRYVHEGKALDTCPLDPGNITRMTGAASKGTKLVRTLTKMK